MFLYMLFIAVITTKMNISSKLKQGLSMNSRLTLVHDKQLTQGSILSPSTTGALDILFRGAGLRLSDKQHVTGFKFPLLEGEYVFLIP